MFDFEFAWVLMLILYNFPIIEWKMREREFLERWELCWAVKFKWSLRVYIAVEEGCFAKENCKTSPQRLKEPFEGWFAKKKLRTPPSTALIAVAEQAGRAVPPARARHGGGCTCRAWLGAAVAKESQSIDQLKGPILLSPDSPCPKRYDLNLNLAACKFARTLGITVERRRRWLHRRPRFRPLHCSGTV